jgi:transcriptional regulator with XRE-family HTH domain
MVFPIFTNDREVQKMFETLGVRIAELRKKSGMSQSELARRLDVSRSSVQSWECGENHPSTDNLISLSKLFHVSADYLLELTPNQSINVDAYDKQAQELLFRLVQYFDGAADGSVRDPSETDT